MNRRCLIAALLLALMTPPAGAKNLPKVTYPFHEGDTIPLTLSSVDINRLVVSGDKILNLTCPHRFCTTTGHENDPTGSVSLKLNLDLPFTAHLTTEKGRLFALFITPTATPARISEFVPSDGAKAPSVFDRGFDYPGALAAFTKAMMRWQRSGTVMAGFSVHPVDPHTLPKPRGPLPLTPQTVFVGKAYSGLIYEVHNRTPHAVVLTTRQFYSEATRSAALDRAQLAPGATTHLYLVTGGGARHVH